MDLSKLSDKELEAIASGNLSSLSDETLRMLSGEKPKLNPSELIPSVREQAMKAFPSPDYSDIGRQLGLTARVGVTGAMALPNIVGDALNTLINTIAGRQVLPSASQSTANLLTMAGVPEPKTPTERVVQDVSQAMAGVASPPAVAKQLSPRMAEFFLGSPVAQTAPAVGGASAGGLARESDIGPAGQVRLLCWVLLPLLAHLGRKRLVVLLEKLCVLSPQKVER